MKKSLRKRAQSIAVPSRSYHIGIGHRKHIVKSKRSLCRSLSCPCLSSTTTKQPIVHRTSSDISYNKPRHQFRRQKLPKMFINFVQRREASTAPNVLNNISNVAACPCPNTPCGCNCLPPPCNTPAKCLQYMTGYYYYPYGTWFCGPYHVSTGACGPCSGPVTPGACAGSCSPKCSACIGPCSPCGPLSSCGVCGVGGLFSCSTGSPYDYSSAFSSIDAYGPYGQLSPNQYMQQNCYTPFNPYPYYNQFGQFNSMPSNNFGPCYEMPMAVPLPVNNAFVPMQGPFGPDPPPSPTISNQQSFTYSNPTIRQPPASEVMRTSPLREGPCPKNLSPKSLRMSPVSRYDTCMNLSKSDRSPKVLSRFLKDPKSHVACYYSTKYIQKESPNDMQKTFDKTNINISKTIKMLHEKKCKESCNKSFCYWCLHSGRYSRNKGDKEDIVTTQKKLATTNTFNSGKLPKRT